MEHSRLIYLIDKYNNGVLSDTELNELNDWYYSLHLGSTDFAEWINQAGNEKHLAESMLANFNAKVGLRKTPAKSKLYWIAAAAIFIICLGVIGLIYLKSGIDPKFLTTQTSVKKDVLPGSNKAILTLSNGRQLVLNKAAVGRLAIQSNAAIDQTVSGSIVYKESNKVAATTPVYNTLTTPRGGQYFLQLADGSKVWLNAASSIKYPVVFVGNERKVEITGEAYFEVVHNSAKPFRVVAGSQMVEDIGTHFNINAYADESLIKTTLTEGAVKVINSASSLELVPGQQARVSALGDNIKSATVDTSVVVAWKNGLFKFNHARVEEVMRQISRWYDVQIDYHGNIPDRRFTGEITRNVNLSQLLEILGYLHLTFDVHQEGEKTVITIM